MTDTTRRLNVAQMDFEEIKTNLKAYLRSQSNLQDYDYEGSAMGTLVDLLSYVTHYNAVNANLGLNETFLDTAQFRGSVVGHARQLGYTPRSATAAVGYVNVGITNFVGGSANVSIPKGTRFRSTINSRAYEFVTEQEYVSSTGIFESVKLVQGSYKTAEYVYDVTTSEKFLIPDVNVDTSQMAVEVFDSETSLTKRTFTRAKIITDISKDSRIYFLAENPDSRYEISFGDGILGTALENGNLIRVTYLVTDSVDANGAGVFTLVDSISQTSPVTIQTVQRAFGGQEKESIEEIRRNAPLSFASQNRAVTADDYKAIILENFQNVETIAVWGGEDNDPPSYGNVFISIKPKDGEILFAAERETVLNDVIRPKSVVSLTPILVDPEYTYISLEVFYKYDVSTTPLSKATLNNAVRTAIQAYNNSYLSKFDGVLRHSNLVREIDRSNNAILSSSARVYMKKRFTPELNVAQRVELQFSGPIYNDPDDQVIYKTTAFTYAGRQCSLRDVVGSDGIRRVQVVFGDGQNTVVIADNVGTIDTARGKITLSEFVVSNFVGDYIEITMIPNSLDIAPLRNNLLVIDMTDVAVDGEIDTIVAGQSPAGVNYRTTSRHA
jgi:hypothetical protein